MLACLKRTIYCCGRCDRYVNLLRNYDGALVARSADGSSIQTVPAYCLMDLQYKHPKVVSTLLAHTLEILEVFLDLKDSPIPTWHSRSFHNTPIVYGTGSIK